MLTKARRRMQQEEGFTLIELLVVILIIGILAAVAIPTFLSQKNKATASNVESLLKNAQLQVETYATSANGAYPVGSGGVAWASTGSLSSLDSGIDQDAASYSLSYANTGTTQNYTLVASVPGSQGTLALTDANGSESYTCSSSYNYCPTGSW